LLPSPPYPRFGSLRLPHTTLPGLACLGRFGWFTQFALLRWRAYSRLLFSCLYTTTTTIALLARCCLRCYCLQRAGRDDTTLPGACRTADAHWLKRRRAERRCWRCAVRNIFPVVFFNLLLPFPIPLLALAPPRFLTLLRISSAACPSPSVPPCTLYALFGALGS